MDDEGEIQPEPEKICDDRWKRGSKYLTEALIRWKQLPTEEATWEPVDQLEQNFPHLNLEDKVGLKGKGSDVDHIWGEGVPVGPKNPTCL